MLETKTNAEQDKVLFDVSAQGVAQVILNNPEKHNAFDDKIISRLKNLFLDIAKRDDIKIVVLSSNGKNFSAGADLGWMKRMATYSYEDNIKDATELAKMLHALNFLPQTTIVQIQGATFGGAVGLASCCDIVVASDKASFCLSEVKLGLIPATISPYVVQAMGVKACRRYFQTAELFYAEKALSLGLVDEVVPSNLLMTKVDAIVSTLLLNSPAAMKAAKKLIVDVAHKEINERLIIETSEQIASIRVSKEGQEGLTAFFSKRKPSWQSES
tara:strand:+ start:54 stop:869 length:816 start_codon:yes stop_codon:yes gene_type:complete